MNELPSTNASVSVQVRGLRKRFAGLEVLKGVDLEVRRGELFVIMGPSGGGKSVLLKHIIGLEKPDAGEVLIEGQSIHTPGVMDAYRLAMVFQSSALLNSLTVAENVGLYLSEHQLKSPADIERIVQAKLELVGLRGVENKLPAELSGGMKKRVAIARALVIEPQLILYDEPTSELDPIIAVTIGEEILRLNHVMHATTIVVTHDRDLAFGIAGRLAIMLDGTLRTVGAPQQVRACSDPDVQKFLKADFNFDSQVPSQ